MVELVWVAKKRVETKLPQFIPAIIILKKIISLTKICTNKKKVLSSVVPNLEFTNIKDPFKHLLPIFQFSYIFIHAIVVRYPKNEQLATLMIYLCILQDLRCFLLGVVNFVTNFRV